MYHFIVILRPSFNKTFGSYPKSFFALDISGHRLFIDPSWASSGTYLPVKLTAFSIGEN